MGISNRFVSFMERCKDNPSFSGYFYSDSMAFCIVSSLIDVLDQYSGDDIYRALYLVEKYGLLVEEHNLMRWFDPGEFTHLKSNLNIVEGIPDTYTLKEEQRKQFPDFYDGNTIVEDSILSGYIKDNCLSIAEKLKWPKPEEFLPYKFLIGENMLLYKYVYEYLIYPDYKDGILFTEYFS